MRMCVCEREKERERERKKEISHVNNSVVFGAVHPFALYKIGSAGMVRVSIQAVNLGTLIKHKKKETLSQCTSWVYWYIGAATAMGDV